MIRSLITALGFAALLGTQPTEFAVTGQANASFQGSQTATVSGITATFPGAINTSVRYTNGSGSGQVQKMYMKTDTIPASGADTIDVRGVVLDAFGATVDLATVKAMLVSAATTNTNNVNVGGQATGAPTIGVAAANDIMVVKPGGWVGFGVPGTGFAVTAGTDSLRIANSGAGTPVIYTIMLLGT